MYKRILPIIIVILTTYYLILNTAFAEGISLGVYPPILQIDSTPPAIIQAPVTIENLGDNSLNLTIDFKPFTTSDREDGQIQYISDSEANYIDPIIFQRVKIFDPTSSLGQAITQLSLAPKQKKELIIRIDLPREEPPGDYYFSILFLTRANEPTESNSSQSVSGIASNVLLSIGPKGKIKGEIQEFSSPLFMDKGPVPFTVRVKNTSNHFINPKGYILIKNIFGQTVGRVDLIQTNVLANTVRNMPSTDFLSEETGAFWPEKFVLGIYKATLTLALSDQGPILARDVLFLAFPFKILLEIIAGFVIIIYVIVKVRSRA